MRKIIMIPASLLSTRLPNKLLLPLGSKAILQRVKFLKYNNLEILESLEQFRILESGYKIKVLETDHSFIGIDINKGCQKGLNYIKGMNIYH